MESKTTIVIPVGLPGSGKTYYLKKLNKNSNTMFYYDDLDVNDTTLISYNKIVLVNRLFLNTNDIINFLNRFNFDHDINLEIHYWKKDIKKCLFNDKFRRDLSSESTILNKELEEPNIVLIKETFENIININLIEHDIVQKPMHRLFAHRFNLGEDEYFYSDDQGYNTFNKTLIKFEKFDEIIYEIFPEISFLQYKKLFENCINSADCHYINDIKEVYCSKCSCNIEKLYNELNKLAPEKMKQVLNEEN